MKANASLAEKQKKSQEEADNRVKLIRLDLAKDYDEKAKKQEERFKAKRKELQDRIEGLEKEERQMASRLQSAREAQARAEGRVTALEKDLSDLHQQVGPVADAAEEARRNAQIARTMLRQCQRMLQDLVSRARAVGARLGTVVPSLAVEGNDDEARYAKLGKLVFVLSPELPTSPKPLALPSSMAPLSRLDSTIPRHWDIKGKG